MIFSRVNVCRIIEMAGLVHWRRLMGGSDEDEFEKRGIAHS